VNTSHSFQIIILFLTLVLILIIGAIIILLRKKLEESQIKNEPNVYDIELLDQTNNQYDRN
jgi:uncharacterized protein YneF (UPF0154 family)